MSRAKHYTKPSGSSKPRKRATPPGPLFVSLYDGSITVEFNEESIEKLRHNIAAWTTYIDRLSSPQTRDPETVSLVARALLRRGVAHALLEEWRPALRDVSQVIVMRVGDAETNTAYLYRARVQDALGLDEVAIRDWTFVLERIEQASSQPERFPKQLAALGYAYRARLYARLGNYKQTVSDCDRALAFDETYAEAYSVRGGAYNHLGKLTNALSDCTRAIELEKKSVHFYRRGLVHKHVGSYDQAFTDFEQAHRNEPENELFQREYNELLMLRLMRMDIFTAPIPRNSSSKCSDT